MQPNVAGFFDEETFTVSYLVADPATKSCAIIDSVLDFDPVSGRTKQRSAERLLTHIAAQALKVEWVLETHVHADHLSACDHFKTKFDSKLGIGEHVATVQRTFGKIFNAGPEIARDGSQFDRLFKDGDSYTIGTMTAHAMLTPGHTPACMTHVIGNAAFVGDTLFMPDAGSARADFPGGDAATLYRSIRRLLSLPAETRLFMCHDYKAPGRDQFVWETSVAEEREKNVHIRDGVSEPDFVEMRRKRDATLAAPVLLLPAIQVNIRAGKLPEPEANGSRYLKIPMRLSPELET